MTFDISKITIPTDPGIYLMKDSDGQIIYIGKAKNRLSILVKPRI